MRDITSLNELIETAKRTGQRVSVARLGSNEFETWVKDVAGLWHGTDSDDIGLYPVGDDFNRVVVLKSDDDTLALDQGIAAVWLYNDGDDALTLAYTAEDETVHNDLETAYPLPLQEAIVRECGCWHADPEDWDNVVILEVLESDLVDTVKIGDWEGGAGEVSASDDYDTLRLGDDTALWDNQDKATKAVREYWEGMADNDSAEFVHIVGAEKITEYFMRGWGFEEWIAELLRFDRDNELGDQIEEGPNMVLTGFDGQEVTVSLTSDFILVGESRFG